jgi:hypothetical protein
MRGVRVLRNMCVLATLLGAIGVAVRTSGMVVPGVQAAPVASGGACQNFQLHITPLKGDAGAGHIGEMYRIHNVSTSACMLAGYPGAMLLDRNFASLPTQVTRGLGYLVGKRPVVNVMLHGSNDAYFVVEWDHQPALGQQCPTAPYIMITAPNDRLPVVTYGSGVGGGIDACGGNLTVTPVAGTAFGF